MKQWQVAVLPVRHLCETICRNEKNCGSSPVASGHVIGERCLNKPFRRWATTAFRPQNRNNFKRNEGKKSNETTLTTATWGARFQQLLHQELTGWDDLIQGNSCASGLLQLSRSICFPSSRFSFWCRGATLRRGLQATVRTVRGQTLHLDLIAVPTD